MWKMLEGCFSLNIHSRFHYSVLTVTVARLVVLLHIVFICCHCKWMLSWFDLSLHNVIFRNTTWKVPLAKEREGSNLQKMSG